MLLSVRFGLCNLHARVCLYSFCIANRALLETYAMHDIADAKGDFPIHTAIRNAESTEKAAEMMKLIAGHGHDVHARNEKTGETWSDLAALNDKIDAANLRRIVAEESQEK